MGRVASACVLSIVAPCFNEAEVLPEFVRRTVGAGRAAVGEAFEIVLVDDGSTDATWATIAALSHELPQVVGVRLMRNHGHQLAATAGLSATEGQRVMLIDADLQDPPELLSEMMMIMDGGAEVVYGRRVERDGESWFKLASASLFYRLLSATTSMDIPRDTGDFRLMSRRVVDILQQMPERDRFIRGMVSWIGGKQVALDYARDARHAGVTKYPLSKMVVFAIDAITSFSTVPLRISTYAGMISALIAVLLFAYTIWSWLSGAVVPGWASLMVVMSFFSAVQFIVLGIMGEYLGRLVQQSKSRPMYLIEQVTKPRRAFDAVGTGQTSHGLSALAEAAE